MLIFFFFNDTATTEIYTLSLHDALPISHAAREVRGERRDRSATRHQHHQGDGSRAHDGPARRSEEHTSELQSRLHLVCRLLLEKKKNVVVPVSRITLRLAMALTSDFGVS